MIVAAFGTEQELIGAVALLRAEDAGTVETYTPCEFEERDLSDTRISRIPLMVLIVGVLGASGMFLLQTYATTVGYPLDIGGRPDFSWPAYVPSAFEVGVLSAMLAGFVGFLAANRMPRLYQPIDECEAFRNASRDGYFLSIVGPDLARARSLLAELHPALIAEVPQ